MTILRSVAVVIPARNERELIERCLVSVLTAAAEARRRWGRSAPEISVVVVADRCVDGTADLARRFTEVRVLEADAGNVGRARAIGVRIALQHIDSPPERSWISNTDADSAVPSNWISAQVGLAQEHVGMMIGTVRPDFADLTAEQTSAWHAAHSPGHANGHVHGANLGIRADLYDEAGGFPSVEEHEDVELASRVRRLGAKVTASNECEVMTSGRRFGRTPGGYAGFLAHDLLLQPLENH